MRTHADQHTIAKFSSDTVVSRLHVLDAGLRRLRWGVRVHLLRRAAAVDDDADRLRCADRHGRGGRGLNYLAALPAARVTAADAEADKNYDERNEEYATEDAADDCRRIDGGIRAVLPAGTEQVARAVPRQW